MHVQSRQGARPDWWENHGMGKGRELPQCDYSQSAKQNTTICCGKGRGEGARPFFNFKCIGERCITLPGRSLCVFGFAISVPLLNLDGLVEFGI